MGAGLENGRAVRALAQRDHVDFIISQTTLLSPPLIPEIKLYLAQESIALWQKTEEDLSAIGLAPPFWAFAWAGGQGLARYILDHADLVRGRHILDFASGSGLVAIATMLAGATSLMASDIDPYAIAAMALNAKVNGVVVTPYLGDLIGEDLGWDIVLAGDIFYDRDLAAKIMPWLRQLDERGAMILLGDPGRAYLPKSELEKCAGYNVPVTRDLEDADIKYCAVWRLKCLRA